MAALLVRYKMSVISVVPINNVLTEDGVEFKRIRILKTKNMESGLSWAQVLYSPLTEKREGRKERTQDLVST